MNNIAFQSVEKDRMRLREIFETSTEKKRVILTYFIIRILILLLIFRAYEIGRWDILFFNVIALFATFLPAILEKTLSISLPNGFELLFLLFLLPSVFLGAIWGTMLQIFLGMSLGCIGFVLMFILYFNSKVKTSYLLVSLFSFCFSVSLSAIWEVVRYQITTTFGFNTGQLSHSYTINNLSLTMAGAFFVSISGYVYIKYDKANLIQTLKMGFMRKNPRLFSGYENTMEYIKHMLNKGEGKTVEFKSTLRTNLHTNQVDKKMEHSVMKTVAAFMNTDGGTLLVGVEDDGSILGIEQDNFQGKDNYHRHFTNLVKQYTGNEHLPFIRSEVISVDDKSILKVDCSPSDKGVFLKVDNNEEFFVRTGPSSVKLEGSKLLSYVNNRFKKP
jgi:hypothetical protein